MASPILRCFHLWALAAVAGLGPIACEPRPRPEADAMAKDGIRWEATEQNAQALPTDLQTDFDFAFTNDTGRRVEILGCVLPTDVERLPGDYPETAWVQPGQRWGLRVRVHHWKPGVNERPFFVKTTAGTSRLVASVTVPPGNAGLEWAERKLQGAPKEGENLVHFTFQVTNTTEQDVRVLKIDTSCGCTTGKWPRDPWVLTPGETGAFEVEMSRFGRDGPVTKDVYFKTELGITQLSVTGMLPQGPMADNASRTENQALALADPTAIFKGDCARCHVTPGEGLTGDALYSVVCGICHDSEHRAAMVPDLQGKIGSETAAYWRQWINEGKPNSLMPGFSEKAGGPLSPDQIDSLVSALAQP